MINTFEVDLSPEEAYDESIVKQAIFKKLNLSFTDNLNVQPLRRSIDARGTKVVVKLLVEIFDASNKRDDVWQSQFQHVENADQAVVVGAGPAGLFAALRLIELGIKPVILERGKDVQARRRDIAAINKAHVVNEDSNYCFGEGGAGTYSDGKLYTRSKKRGDVKRILELLVQHGAPNEILYDAHPHIGTNKLPQVVSKIRETIVHYGGEFHFNTRIVDLELTRNTITSVLDQHKNQYSGIGIILATGHSARDVYKLLHDKSILIEQKPFALGVRVEHAQSLIDKESSPSACVLGGLSFQQQQVQVKLL
jgi:uncharacterized FAD-dependent dehydrogenase